MPNAHALQATGPPPSLPCLDSLLSGAHLVSIRNRWAASGPPRSISLSAEIECEAASTVVTGFEAVAAACVTNFLTGNAIGSLDILLREEGG